MIKKSVDRKTNRGWDTEQRGRVTERERVSSTRCIHVEEGDQRRAHKQSRSDAPWLGIPVSFLFRHFFLFFLLRLHFLLFLLALKKIISRLISPFDIRPDFSREHTNSPTPTLTTWTRKKEALMLFLLSNKKRRRTCNVVQAVCFSSIVLEVDGASGQQTR